MYSKNKQEMISYEQFIEKFPNTESLEKAYPVGKKVVWSDRNKYTIVGYQTDRQFKNKNEFEHLVIIKHWSKHKQRWFYHTLNSFIFYSVVEMMERETKEDKKQK